MNLATSSSNFRFAVVSGVIALTACLFSAGCSADAGTGGEGVDQGAQAATTAPAPVPAGVRTYPPHGYPCLGCHPCGDSYCDNFNNSVVWSGSGGSSAAGVPASK